MKAVDFAVVLLATAAGDSCGFLFGEVSSQCAVADKWEHVDDQEVGKTKCDFELKACYKKHHNHSRLVLGCIEAEVCDRLPDIFEECCNESLCNHEFKWAWNWYHLSPYIWGSLLVCLLGSLCSCMGYTLIQAASNRVSRGGGGVIVTYFDRRSSNNRQTDESRLSQDRGTDQRATDVRAAENRRDYEATRVD